MKKIYLDHNATTPAREEALQAMLPYYKDCFGNASGIYSFGRDAKKALEASRETIASFLGASCEEIIFTSGGTESDNLAIKGACYANRSKGNHIITSRIEHPAVLNTCRHLEKNGFQVTYAGVDSHGLVNTDEIRSAVTNKTILITVMHANNETGMIQPVPEIAKIAKDKNVLFHTDAVQSVGKIPVDVNALNVDLLSVSGHKIHGPKGAGALYIRRGTRIEPVSHGGHQEKELRAGTENIPAIAGFAKAAQILSKKMTEENHRIKLLRNKLWDGLKNNIDAVRLNADLEKCLPNTLNISFEYIESEAIILNLDLKGIAVSGGSACSSEAPEPSYVLTSMGIDAACAQGAVRFSLGKDNTGEEIDYVLKNTCEIIEKLRRISPLYKK